MWIAKMQLAFVRLAFVRKAVFLFAALLTATSSLPAQTAGKIKPDILDPVPTTDETIRKQAEQAPLALEFHGKTKAECEVWQEKFAAKLRSLLGPHTPPKKWETLVERRVKMKDHLRADIVLLADGIPPVPAYVLTPLTKSKTRRPGILALHGHGNYGHDPVAGRDDVTGVANAIRSANYDYGLQFLRQGYVVIAPCMTPFGRRLGDRDKYGKQDPCGITFIRMQLLGKTLIAENLRDCLWAFEYLARHEEVDPDRIGCVGLSYGGRMTMLTTALEPRIKAADISGALNVMQERVQVRYSCGAQIIPGLLQYGDVPEIISLIAPRPCVIEIGSRDGLIKKKWADNALVRIRRAYSAYAADSNLHVDRFEGGHRFNGVVALEVFEKALKK